MAKSKRATRLWERPMRRTMVTLLAVLLMTKVAVAAEWYQGGTLHTATLNDWRFAPYANRLATAADMAYVALKDKITITSPHQMRPYAQELESCISGIAAEQTGWDLNLKAGESAATCVILMGWM